MLMNELKAIHFRRPYWASPALESAGYAKKVSGSWRLTKAGFRLLEPELDRIAAALYPEDPPRI